MISKDYDSSKTDCNQKNYANILRGRFIQNQLPTFDLLLQAFHASLLVEWVTNSL